MDNQKFVKSQKEIFQKLSKRIGFGTIFTLLAIIILFTAFKVLNEYIWMDTIGFSSVYTTIIYSKITLGIVGFLLFFIFKSTLSGKSSISKSL